MNQKPFFLLLLAMLVTVLAMAQDHKYTHSERARLHNEVPDDPYLPNAYGNKKTTPAYRSRSVYYFTVQANVNENGENIVGDAANKWRPKLDFPG